MAVQPETSLGTVAAPSYVATICGPGHAEIYPGGVTVDPSDLQLRGNVPGKYGTAPVTGQAPTNGQCSMLRRVAVQQGVCIRTSTWQISGATA